MKILSIQTAVVFWSVSLLVPAGHAVEPAPPIPLHSAQVTLPYAELRALIDAQAPPTVEQPAPVGAIVRSAHYALDLTPGNATGSATFDVHSLEKGWHIIPLLDSKLPVTTITPAEATLINRDGMLCLVVRDPGSHQVSITFASGRLADAPLSIQTAPANTTRITLANTPNDKAARVDGASPATSANDVFLSPPSGGLVTIQLVSDQPDIATRWQHQAEALATEDIDQLLIKTRVQLSSQNPESGNGISATLLLPRQASIQSIEGPDLKDWKPAGFDSNGTQQQIKLRWTTRGMTSRRINIHYSLPHLEIGNAWHIPLPAFVDSTSTGARVTAIVPDGIELKPVLENGATLQSAAPRSFGTIIAGSELMTIASSDGSAVTFKATIRPRMKTAPATIHDAKIETRLAANGGLLSSATFAIEHQERFRWKFNLPPDSTLLACTINGKRVDPLIGSDGGLDLPMPAPQSGSKPTQVTFSYTGQYEKFNPVEGRIELILPSTPLFAHELTWKLSLPANYKATALEGNVEIVEGGSSGKPIVLRKQLFRATPPQAALFYAKTKL